MPSSGMRCCVVLVRTDVSVVPSSLRLYTLMVQAMHSYETSVPTMVIRRHIPVDGILQTCAHLQKRGCGDCWFRILDTSAYQHKT
jgi:hypothetical protein